MTLVIVSGAALQGRACKRLFNSILRLGNAGLLGTMSAAIENSRRFYAMSDDSTLAMSADRRQGLDRAFKAVEDMVLGVNNNFETFVVCVSADLASGHPISFR